MNKTFEEFQAAGQKAQETYAASASAMTKGFQEAASETIEYSRKAAEKGQQAVEKLMDAKTFDKVIEAQQGIVLGAYEDFMAHMTKYGEIFTASAKQAAKPFEAQFSAMTGTANKKTAAK